MLWLGPSSAQAYALHQAIEEGINHMVTCSMLQTHPNAVVVCDEVRSDVQWCLSAVYPCPCTTAALHASVCIYLHPMAHRTPRWSSR